MKCEKPKILFVIDAMRKGGIRTSLINLLSNVDVTKYEISLFCFHLTNEDKEILPKEINIIESNRLFDLVASTGEEVRNKSFFFHCIRKVLALLCRVFGSNRIYNFIIKTEKRVFDTDVAISYTNNVGDRSLYFGANKFVLEKVNAKKRVAWLHADYEAMELNSSINNNEYRKMDMIIAVSEATKLSFLRHNEECEEKTLVLYNLINQKDIEKKSNEKLMEEFDKSQINCLSVMRLDSNKDPLYQVEIAKEMKKRNINFVWRILGDGPLYTEVIKTVKQNKLEDCVKVYGHIKNPYPYYRQSQVYVSTSLSESYGLSIVEALYFGMQIVCSKYEAVDEVLNKENGKVIDKDINLFVECICEAAKEYNPLIKKEILHTNEESLKILYNQIFSD